MLTAREPRRRRATEMLLVATLCWGISFPVMKAIGMVHADLLPGSSSWFASAGTVMVRFGVAALLMLMWSWRTLREVTRAETWQGLGLGVFGGAGILLQMDGLAYTSASSSAFLTQCYCLLLPWIVAWRDRRRPSGVMLACSLMVVAGVAVLANVDWRTLRLGRGELETLLSSLIFTGQILWLERPCFAGNRVKHFTLVMFVTMALIAFPVAWLNARNPSDWMTIWSAPAVLGLTAVLIVFCTMIAFLLMNRWQACLPAAEAGLVYTTEPLFASLFALFLPAWLSVLVHIHYPNEQATSSLLIGGGLITVANVLIQIHARRSATSAKGAAGIEALGHPPELIPAGEPGSARENSACSKELNHR